MAEPKTKVKWVATGTKGTNVSGYIAGNTIEEVRAKVTLMEAEGYIFAPKVTKITMPKPMTDVEWKATLDWAYGFSKSN